MLREECETAWSSYHHWIRHMNRAADKGDNISADHYAARATNVKVKYGLLMSTGGCIEKEDRSTGTYADHYGTGGMGQQWPHAPRSPVAMLEREGH